MFDCELPSCFTQKIRVARKSHKCCECGSGIVKGERYEYSSGIWDSIPDSYKTCKSCADLRDDYIDKCGDQVGFGYLRESISEAFYQGYGAVEFAKDYEDVAPNICKLFGVKID